MRNCTESIFTEQLHRHDDCNTNGVIVRRKMRNCTKCIFVQRVFLLKSYKVGGLGGHANLHWVTSTVSLYCILAYTLSVSVSISALSGGHVLSNGMQKQQKTNNSLIAFGDETLRILEGGLGGLGGRANLNVLFSETLWVFEGGEDLMCCVLEFRNK